METAQKLVQLMRFQRQDSNNKLDNLVESGVYNSELLTRLLSLRSVAEKHLEWPYLVLMVLQSGYAQWHNGQHDAHYLHACEHHVDTSPSL